MPASCQHVDHVPEEDRAVGGDQRLVVLPVLLELTPCVLVVVRVVAPAQLVDVLRDPDEVVPHAAQALGLVARLGAVVERIRDVDVPLLVTPQEVVLRLHTGLEHPAVLFTRLVQEVAEDDPWRIGPRLSLHVGVAVQDRDVSPPRQPHVGLRVRDGHQVRIGRGLPHVTDREPCEPGAGREQHVQ